MFFKKSEQQEIIAFWINQHAIAERQLRRLIERNEQQSNLLSCLSVTNASLKKELEIAQKNDHRDPETGRFTKAEEEQ